MKLVVGRSQEAGDRGIRFLVYLHVALRQEEHDLVRLYGLHQFRISTFTLHQLLQGVYYEGGSLATPTELEVMTPAVTRARDALRKEQEVKQGCRAFVAALTDLRDFDESSEEIYEMVEEPDQITSS